MTLAPAPEPALAAAPETPDEPAQRRRNFRLGVLNGALYMGGEGFIDASTVIPVFLSRLTASSGLIGLASALGDAGWMLPQFLVTPWLAKRRRQLPLYRYAAIARGGALGLLAVLIWPLASHPTALLVAFFVCYGTYAFGAGAAGLPFLEVVGRTVPPQRLGAYWSARMFWGGSFVAIAGLFVREILKLDDFATRFGILFGLATVIVSIAYALFSAIREPDCPPGESPDTPLALLAEGVRLVREGGPFRHLLLARGALAAWLTVSPFMVLFAVRDLGGGGRAAGTFLMARVAGYVLSNLAWPRVAERWGPRGVMTIAAIGSGVVGLAAAAIAVLSPWKLGLMSATASIIALESLAALGGATQSGLLVGYGSFVLQLAPEGRRLVFVSLMNTFIGPTMLLPALGGVLVDAINAPVVFALCALLAWTGARAAAKLPRVMGRGLEAAKEDCGCS